MGTGIASLPGTATWRAARWLMDLVDEKRARACIVEDVRPTNGSWFSNSLSGRLAFTCDDLSFSSINGVCAYVYRNRGTCFCRFCFAESLPGFVSDERSWFSIPAADAFVSCKFYYILVRRSKVIASNAITITYAASIMYIFKKIPIQSCAW